MRRLGLRPLVRLGAFPAPQTAAPLSALYLRLPLCELRRSRTVAAYVTQPHRCLVIVVAICDTGVNLQGVFQHAVLWFVCRSGSDSRGPCVSRDCQCRVGRGDHQWRGHGHHGPNRSDFGLAGTTSFGIHATLYSDGTARGHVNCVDQVGSTFPGNIFGDVTSWEGSLDGSITLNVVGKLVGFPGGHPQDVSFTVTIQRFGGAGVGEWTLSLGADTACFETLLSGQIVLRRRS
jgi:hypothetical protein